MMRALPSSLDSQLPPPAPGSGERRSRPPVAPCSPRELDPLPEGRPAPDLPPTVAQEKQGAPEISPKVAERAHHLDFLRASMMILGVFVHASHADYDQGSYEPLRFLSGSFRMACFFIISGYFSAAMLERYTLGDFLRRRLLALGLPAAVCVFVLNPPALTAMRQYFATAPVAVEPTVNWHLHVWFLFVLMLYSLIARPLSSLWQAASGALVRVLGPGFAEALGLALLTAVASVALKALEKWGPSLSAFDQYAEISFSALENLPYFACGLAMQRSPRIFRFAHARPWAWAVAAIGLLGSHYWLEQREISTTPQHLLHLTLDFATAFACSFALLSAAERWIRRPRRWVTLTAASAYTIYVVHYLCISVLLVLTQRWGFSQPLRAVTAALGALGVGYAVHFGLVERFSLAALLLNGRLPRSARPR